MSNPVPSDKISDGKLNFGTADVMVNSDDHTVTTRTGKVIRTFAGINAEFDAAQAGQFVAASQDAADRAETAAEVAAAAGRVYETSAAGQADSELVDGDYFWVVSAEDSEVLELWRKGASSPTDTGKRTVDSNFVFDVENRFNRSASQLFEVDKLNLFPDANLEVRRYTAQETFNDYAGGYSQTATQDGLLVEIPESGSSAITHHLRTNITRTTESISVTFNVSEIKSSTCHLGLGYINDTGEYIFYALSNSGVPRKYTNFSRVDLSGVEGSYSDGDELKIEVSGGRVFYFVNDSEIFSIAHDDGEFEGQLLISQAGFVDYVTTLSEQSDPIRNFIKEFSDESMFVELSANDHVTVYERTKTGTYISYPIQRIVNAGLNYDCWSFRLSNEYTLTDSGMSQTSRFSEPLISGGVQEAPWRETPGGNDFISGTAHGDENTEGLLLQIDGVIYDATQDNVFIPCKHVRFVVDSIVKSNITPDEEVMRRKRIYDFSGNGLSLDMQNTFINEKRFTIMYHNAASGIASNFNQYYLETEYDLLNVGDERSVAGDFREYTALGDGVSLTVSVSLIETDQEIAPSFLMASSGKPYFDLLNGGVGAQTFEQGDKIRIKSNYRFDISE